MKKIKKHRFTHPDPEGIKEAPKRTETGQKRISEENLFMAKDLKRALINIAAFTILVVILYFLDSKFSLFQSLRDIIL